MTLLLIILIIAFAAAGGFLGDLLEFAGWLILILALLGAAAGAFVYISVRRFFRPTRGD